MSAQTIIHPSITSIKKEAEDTFIKNANKHILKKNFALGEGYCSFEQLDAALTYDIIRYGKCNLLKIIEEGIESYEDAEKSKNKTTSLKKENGYRISETIKEEDYSVIYKLWLSKGNSGTIDEFLNLILKDEELKLESNNW